jgi:hypothetical protein
MSPPPASQRRARTGLAAENTARHSSTMTKTKISKPPAYRTIDSS